MLRWECKEQSRAAVCFTASQSDPFGFGLAATFGDPLTISN